MKKIIYIFLLVSALGLFYFSFFAGQSTKKSSSPPTTTTTKPAIDPKIFELTLDKIFGTNLGMGKINKDELVTLIMTGDIIPARHVNAKVVGYGYFTHPYLKTADYLKDADLTVTNLEAPIFEGCPVVSSGMRFCGDARHVEGLKFAGIDIASVANNHSGNYGEVGAAKTISILKKSEIQPAGLGEIAKKNIKGVKFTFLAYNGVEEHFDLGKIETDIESVRSDSDVVVVIPHWGKEYVRIPTTDGSIAPEDPKEIGKKMIDWGADIVLGNHPHWYQGVEIYKNKLIAYAHGNFVFDQEWSEETTLGVVGKYTFYKGKLVDVSYKPIKIIDYNQPYFLDGSAANDILKIMKDNSWRD